MQPAGERCQNEQHAANRKINRPRRESRQPPEKRAGANGIEGRGLRAAGAVDQEVGHVFEVVVVERRAVAAAEEGLLVGEAVGSGQWQRVGSSGSGQRSKATRRPPFHRAITRGTIDFSPATVSPKEAAMSD